MKQCPRCGKTKPSDEFYSKRSSYCKPCERAKNRAYYQIHKESRRAKARQYYRENEGPRRKMTRDYHFKHRYGITADERDAMEKKQQGLCAICGWPSKTSRRLAVDHNHKTGKVRALLCNSCNTGLGYLEDKSWHEVAQRYLVDHS